MLFTKPLEGNRQNNLLCLVLTFSIQCFYFFTGGIRALKTLLANDISYQRTSILFRNSCIPSFTTVLSSYFLRTEKLLKNRAWIQAKSNAVNTLVWFWPMSGNSFSDFPDMVWRAIQAKECFHFEWGHPVWWKAILAAWLQAVLWHMPLWQ